MPKARRDTGSVPSKAVPLAPALTATGTVMVNTLPLIVKAPVASNCVAEIALIAVERNVASGNLRLSNQAGLRTSAL